MTQRSNHSGAGADPGVPHLDEQMEQQFLHPVSQVYFRAGLLACREYMARFVEAESPSIAMSIRANWWPVLGRDFGPPRQLDFAELTDGEFGPPTFRVRTADEVSPTQEALPIALHFLEAGQYAAPSDPAVAARLVGLREEVRNRLDAAKAARVAPSPAPRYDNVFYEGTAALDGADRLVGSPEEPKHGEES